MNGKTTHVLFHGERVTESPQLYQYDYGQSLVFDDITLPETYEVLFSNGITQEAKTVLGNTEGVQIPDEYLTTGKNVLAWIFLHDGDDDGETEYVIRIPIRPRSVLSDDEITEEEHSIVSDLIALVDSMKETLSAYETRIHTLEERIPALGGWKNNGGETDDSTAGSD